MMPLLAQSAGDVPGEKIGGILGGMLSSLFQWILDLLVWLVELVLDLILWILDLGLSAVGWDSEYMTNLFTLPEIPAGLSDLFPAVNAWVPLAEWWIFASFYFACTRGLLVTRILIKAIRG